MYEALEDQTRQSVELLSDLRPSPSARPEDFSEFFNLVYNNLCRPSWGWNFEDFWLVLDWIVRHPNGGNKWQISEDASMPLIDEENRSRLRSMAERWLQREEAEHLFSIAERVRTFTNMLDGMLLGI
jgi:hypothetical protein